MKNGPSGAGGKNKSREQINNVADSFVVAGEVEFSVTKISLWIFGFLVLACSAGNCHTFHLLLRFYSWDGMIHLQVIHKNNPHIQATSTNKNPSNSFTPRRYLSA